MAPPVEPAPPAAPAALAGGDQPAGAPAAPASILKKPNKDRAESAGARNRRRQRIRAEVKAKAANDGEVWALQQRLLSPGAPESLMEAARQLLETNSYDAIVEERALEGLCGFPPCKEATASVAPEKKWTINARTREVYSTSQIAKFCSLACMRENSAFSLRLEPEPAYARHNAAVAAARGALAATQGGVDARGTGGPLDQPDGPAPHMVDAAPSSELPARPDAATSAPGSGEPTTKGRPVPKVRQKAVVRFSRVNQSYSVEYGDYDGGGDLPGVASVATPAGSLAAPAGAAAASRQPTGVHGMLRAPVLERQPDAATQQASGGDDAAQLGPPAFGEGAPRAEVLQQQPATLFEETPESASAALDAATAAPTAFGPGWRSQRSARWAAARDEAQSDTDRELADLLAGSDDSGDEHFETDVGYPAMKCDVPWVKAWAVLANWMGEGARQVLHKGRIDIFFGDGEAEEAEEERPAHKGRRLLLQELLVDRLPGDLTFMGPRYHSLIAALSVHQALPSVTEHNMYDLMAALLLRALYRADAQRGVLTSDKHISTRLDKLVEGAGQQFGVVPDELQPLEKLLA